MPITNEQKQKLNRACNALRDSNIGEVLQDIGTQVAHTVVAGDVGATNTVVELAFDGTPVAGVFTVLNDTGVEISGYTVAYALNKATVTIVKASLPVGGKVSAILW